jgi:hypothetical protein
MPLGTPVLLIVLYPIVFVPAVATALVEENAEKYVPLSCRVCPESSVDVIPVVPPETSIRQSNSSRTVQLVRDAESVAAPAEEFVTRRRMGVV